MPCIFKSCMKRRTKAIPPPTEVRASIALLTAEIARQSAGNANQVGDKNSVEQYKAKVTTEVEEVKETLGGIKEPTPPQPFLGLGAALVWSRQPNPLDALSVTEPKKEITVEAGVVKKEEISRAL